MAATSFNITIGKAFAIDGNSYPTPKPSRSFLGNGVSMLYALAKGSSTSTSLDQDYESNSGSTGSPADLWALARDSLLNELQQHSTLVEDFHAEHHLYLVTRFPMGAPSDGLYIVTVKQDAMPLGFQKRDGGCETTLEGYLQRFMNSGPQMLEIQPKEHVHLLEDMAANSEILPTELGIEYYQAAKVLLQFAPGQRYSGIRTSPFRITAIEKELADNEKAVVLRNKLITGAFEGKLSELQTQVDKYASLASQGKVDLQACTSLCYAYCAVARLIRTVIEVRKQVIDMLTKRANAFDMLQAEPEVPFNGRKSPALSAVELMV